MSVLNLDQVNSSSVEIAGGKGANLGELIAADFPVPPGFVVSAAAYSQFIETLEIPANDDLPEDTDRFIDIIRTRIISATLPPELTTAIREHHDALQLQRSQTLTYAVRSSATAEDLADASFAGQHETYYYVEADDIGLMVRKCWASLWSDQAFSYRQSQNIEHRAVSMAVIVQELVRADVSGVTFTADPVSGSETVVITESSWGMGAAIVDGRVSPDQYVVDKATGHLTAIRISDKKFMVPAILETGQQSRLLEVPASQRRAESLTDEQAREIAQVALKAEAHFGKPQDLEWAIQDDELFMLQSRPITIMGSIEDDVPAGRYILFKPVAENFTDPLMPLTQDVLTGILPMMKFIHGRMYMDFNFIRNLIPMKMNDADIARLAYLSGPQNGNIRVSVPRMLMLAVIVGVNYLTMAVFNRRTANMPDDFMQGFRDHVRKVVDDDRISATNTMIVLFARFRFFEPAGNMVLLVNLVAPRYILLLEVMSRLLKRWAPGLPEDTASLLCAGNEGVLSTEMGREIVDLARLAREDTALGTLIREHSAEQALQLIRNTDEQAVFNSALNAFLAKHGHRALKEFEISSVRWEEDPAPIIGMVRNYLLADSDLDGAEAGVKDHRRARLEQVKAELEKLPLERLGHPRWRLLEKLTIETRYYIKLRENSRFYHIMGFYAARLKILKIEKSLLERKILKCKDDIFYLYWREIRDLQSGKLGWLDVEDTIRARRMEHIRLSKLVASKTIGIDLEEIDAPPGGRSLSGQGASPGRYEGVARVIMDPATDNEIEPGEILIAPYTDPAWTPLFLTASAAVIEVGSYLSHAGTIAREYGMPCVVDVTNCTTRITTGSRILVDGTTGAVQLLDETDHPEAHSEPGTAEPGPEEPV